MINVDYYLFIYDIHLNKNITKIVKRLEKINSMRIQKSIFEIQGSKNEILQLINDIGNLIDPLTDKLAIIPLCKRDYEKVEFYGVLSRRPKMLETFYIL